ncbi:MAG: DMT family transporter [Desulfobacterales bacterium]|nr:DMT family transporter [Desulfobacterales bacterium]
MYRAYLEIHIAVLLFGVSGLFGKFLEASPGVIVFGRTLFASMALVLVLAMRKESARIKSPRDLLGFLLMGAILAAHWVTFFHAIQISTVAVGLLTYSSFPIFVTFLEPFFFNERVALFDVAISVVVFIGLILVIPEFDLSNNITQGALWGTVSGLTFAVLSILNRKFVATYSALTIALYQDAVACLILLPFVGGAALAANGMEWVKLILLGVVFTALAHTLFIRGLVRVKAQLASVIACMEPVYGILLALVVLREIPSAREIAGGVVIIGAIVYATRRPGGRGKADQDGQDDQDDQDVFSLRV